MAATHPNFKLHRKKEKFLARGYSSRKVISPYKAAIWIGNIRPTPLSREYTVKIEFHHGRKPSITVLSPKLELAEGKKRLPHTYICGSLCLYTPDRGEWHAGLSLASTIVPWTAMWLYYYEIWLITGKWHGDEKDPYHVKEI